MICERCKFAQWDLTANGRKHPNGKGQCLWEATFIVAGSRYSKDGYGHAVTLSGDAIWRTAGHEHPKRCDVFQPMKSE